MGLFSKIKDILFEDEGEDPSTENMPVFSKEDSVANNKDSVTETVSFDDDEEEPLKVITGSRFRNDKRDLELTDTDLFGDEEVKKEEESKEELPVSHLEDSSPILPFDEDEFDRLNARVNREIEKAQEKSVRETYQERESLLNNVDARKANNNFSSTDAPRERLEENRGEKKFTPSPVISPVYGILDKNYTKDDIVDRVGGLKREKKVKTKDELPKEVEEVKAEIVKAEVKEEDIPILKEEIVHEEPIKVDLDSVRKKAFGSIDNLLEEALEEVNHSNGEAKKEVEAEPVEVEDVTPIVVEPEKEEVEETSHVVETPEVEEPILDKVEEKEEEVVSDEGDKMIEDLLDEEAKKEEKDVSDLILKDIDEEEEKREERKELDDMEKTSTLKILDDIEKELNDVEPVAKKENLDNTLESDLFNLIDSMYEKGEDE